MLSYKFYIYHNDVKEKMSVAVFSLYKFDKNVSPEVLSSIVLVPNSWVLLMTDMKLMNTLMQSMKEI